MPDESTDSSDSGETVVNNSGKPKRVKSTIQFPYNDLDDAVEVARKMWDNYSGACSINDLAGAFQQATSSGAFRTKVLAAKQFGFVTGTQDLSLTALGRRVVDSRTAAASRAEAFLAVSLFREIYEDVAPSGGKLPDNKGLESLIRRLGVVEKQVDKARQVFQRSAKQAGFQGHGTDRLVRPGVGNLGDAPEDDGGTNDPDPDDNGTTSPVMTDPLITGLLKRLPDPKAGFSEPERKVWLSTFEMNLALIYSAPKEWVFDRPEPAQVEPFASGSGSKVYKGSDKLE